MSTIATFIISSKHGKFNIIIDKEDSYLIDSYGWCISERSKGYFNVVARVKGKNKNVYLHRLLLNLRDSKIFVDHINGNPLDNRKVNLRLCNKTQNTYNKKLHSKNKSGYRGVCWCKIKNKWRTTISIKNTQFHLGYYTDKHLAAMVYNDKAKELFKEFATLNIIGDSHG